MLSTWCRGNRFAVQCVIGNTCSYRDISTKKNQQNVRFKPIADTIDRTSESFVKTLKQNKKLETDYLRVLEIIRQGGGQKGVERHIKQGKMLVRDRLSHLLDNIDEFFELSSIAGLGMPYGDVPAASVITGFGKVNDSYVMVIANDGTVKGGTIFPITLKKQLRAQQIAQELSIPCVYIVDSGGAFLPLQAEIFIEGGKAFYNEAVMSSKGIPQVAVVCGMCTAGGAYIPTMADETIMVHKTGSIFLAGPPLVKAALGEVISAEELGGATMHSTVSGCVDHFARDENESYEICRDVISSLNLPQCTFPDNPTEPLYDIMDLCGMVSIDHPNAHQLISRLVDGSRFQEFKPLFGKSMVTGFASISGILVGIIANSGQTACADASVKASHFVQLCGQRRLPIVFLTNHSEHSSDSADPEVCGNQLKCHAWFMAAVACCDVPKVTIVTGGFHGINSYAMGSKAFGSNFVFNWPSSSFGMHASNKLKDALISEVDDSMIEKICRTTSAQYAASNVWTDGIILPQQTRQVLTEVLQIFKYSEAMKQAAEKAVKSRQVNYRM